MEIFGSVIWVATAILAALIYSNASKARKAAKKAGIPREIPAEAWPTTSMTAPKRQENQRKPDDGTTGTNPYEERTTSQRHSGNTTHGAPQTSHPAPSAAPVPKQPRQRTKYPAEAFERSEKSEMLPQTPSCEEFDLRQAIVLSEILHPKFDE